MIYQPDTTLKNNFLRFSKVKSIALFTLELVHKVGWFAVGRGGDEISMAGVGASEWLGGDVDGTSLAAGTVAGEHSGLTETFVNGEI